MRLGGNMGYCWYRFGESSDTFCIIFMVGHSKESVGAYPRKVIGNLVTPGGRGAATKEAECGPAAMLPFGQIIWRKHFLGLDIH